ncbi:AtpZ/AtpI family protein [Polaribacter tangerinus]|uniref:AtpZ/AtpI family protein n=1 Tax=Polaribacter tangerinus TaxID=1920034 RepID=UPI000B4B0367|nr:AtpZ/AtpI family protein [Polaribacter tangerinus]
MTKNNKPKKTHHKAIALSGAGLQMGITIYLGFLLGKWLDNLLETTFLKGLVTLLAVFIATYALIKQANKIND